MFIKSYGIIGPLIYVNKRLLLKPETHMFINIQVNMPPNDLHWVIYLIQYRKILTKVQPSWPRKFKWVNAVYVIVLAL